MALYVPAGARRRRLILGIALGLLVGLGAGLVIGRSSAPRIADRVDAVRVQAADAATALQRLPIEYEQALTAAGESTATITAAIERARTQLADAYRQAIWLGPDAAQDTDRALDALVAAAGERVDLARFQAAVDAAVAAIGVTFALPG